MASFQRKLVAGLAARKVQVSYDLESPSIQAVLVVGGSRNLAGLWQAHRRGIPIVQRLDGMNWLHKRLKTGLRHYLRAEYGNLLLSRIRSHLASRIVYQSQFARRWWETVYGASPVPNTVIYNGVDLQSYTCHGSHERPRERYRLLLVEGNLGGGYELGLDTAVRLGEQLINAHRLSVELEVVGKVSPEVQASQKPKNGLEILWTGVVEPGRIPQLDRSAHLLFSGDLNAACPNSVIEALACGLPVVAFDSGALVELLDAEAGRVVPYGGDPWILDSPDVPALAEAAAEILMHQDQFRPAARLRAEAMFGLDEMVEKYLRFLV